MTRTKTDPRAGRTDASTPRQLVQQQSSPIVENDIARRAYGRYLARGCAPGHDLDDWLDAEREVQPAVASAPE